MANLGLTNGYLTSVLMIMAPKSVQIQHAETSGIVMVLFLVVGLASGSVIAWFWVIGSSAKISPTGGRYEFVLMMCLPL
ncbi:hypothetical protein ERO13_A01G064450v2 [Gossypium hirsutum]|nr:hypothetical protein ERO13_A01G064450v2 [Gossypium hirsutum]TYG51304.1 hypothetical protein ES288_D10G247600v1 [Gossypium darwinii]TYG53858.1 hypothetical protein ES288_D09G142600v1 [Gossypium darwinii]TYG62857.1 hypothetical protein ES288_D07G265800v1 [Gossypium darwinii]TYG73075.1 hypothetical protein ES288_D04G071200v1 [Gossypium darwinii]